MAGDRATKWEISARKRLGRLRQQLGLSYRSKLEERQLDTYFEGKSVALVGNARSLAETDFGHLIDRNAIVLRLNAAPIPSSLSHGTRTDIVATSIVFPKKHFDRLGAEMIWWMTPAPMSLPSWMTRSSGFFLYPKSRHSALAAELLARPTTGLMVIDMLREFPCASVDIFGFDFFSSFSLSNSKAVLPAAHNFERERDYVLDLLARNPHFRLIPSVAAQPGND